MLTMFYIHQAVCISPQETHPAVDLTRLREPVSNKLEVLEPVYEGIPPNLLRRMGKTVRIGIGACAPILQKTAAPVSGIIIGTANGGTEESIHFLQQIITYDEGIISPGGFVQSTANATASQLSMLDKNHGYNLTHVHRGLAFEHALLDASMLAGEHGQRYYLLAGVDEMSSSNYTLDSLEGWYKKEPIPGGLLYEPHSIGTIAGEGAAAFLISRQKANARVRLDAISVCHCSHPHEVRERLERFLGAYLPAGVSPDLFLSGENGDCRTQEFYEACEAIAGEEATIARFKHICGEYPTASAFAVWLASELLSGLSLPGHMVKRWGEGKRRSKDLSSAGGRFRYVLIYNHYKGVQHSFILLSAVGGGIGYGTGGDEAGYGAGDGVRDGAGGEE